MFLQPFDPAAVKIQRMLLFTACWIIAMCVLCLKELRCALPFSLKVEGRKFDFNHKLALLSNKNVDAKCLCIHLQPIFYVMNQSSYHIAMDLSE